MIKWDYLVTIPPSLKTLKRTLGEARVLSIKKLGKNCQSDKKIPQIKNFTYWRFCFMAKMVGPLVLVNGRRGKGNKISSRGLFIQLDDEHDQEAAYDLEITFIEAFIENSVVKRTLVPMVMRGKNIVPWKKFQKNDLIELLNKINEISSGARSAATQQLN